MPVQADGQINWRAKHADSLLSGSRDPQFPNVHLSRPIIVFPISIMSAKLNWTDLLTISAVS